MNGNVTSAPGVGTISIHPRLFPAREMIEDGKYEQAAQYLIGFLRQNPDNADALAMLGQTANRLGALGQAEHFMRKAIQMGARAYDNRFQLATILNQQARPVPSARMLEALQQERPDPNTRLLLASIYEKIGESERAREMFGELAQQNPNHAPTLIAYGHSLRSAGQVDEAVAAYRQAIAADDGFGDAWWGLASIKAKILTDEDIETMRAALAIAIDDRNIAPLHFALARAFHDRKQHAEAFGHYKLGNDLRAKSLDYNADELSGEVSETARMVDAAYLSKMSHVPVGDAVPVFIISLPRSGSTLLEQMLGSHSQIEPVGELPYAPAILRSFMEMATRRGKLTVPQAITALPDEQAAAFGRDYMERAEVHRTEGTRFFLDKLPQNWSNVLFIRKILPQARFIDIRRPAMDCCWSNFTQSFTSAHPSSFALEDMGRAYADNVRLMAHFDAVAPGMIHHVDYSALVEDPKTQIGAALDYLGLEWEDDILQFHQSDRVVRTPSSEQVRRPLNRDGMEVWRPYAEYLGPLRDTLGDLAEA